METYSVPHRRVHTTSSFSSIICSNLCTSTFYLIFVYILNTTLIYHAIVPCSQHTLRKFTDQRLVETRSVCSGVFLQNLENLDNPATLPNLRLDFSADRPSHRQHEPEHFTRFSLSKCTHAQCTFSTLPTAQLHTRTRLHRLKFQCTTFCNIFQITQSIQMSNSCWASLCDFCSLWLT